jgi:hypothetical protein
MFEPEWIFTGETPLQFITTRGPQCSSAVVPKFQQIRRGVA